MYHYFPHRCRDIWLSNMPLDHSHVSLCSSQISGHFIVQYAARPFTCIITFLTDVGTFGCPICHETIHTYHYVPHRYRDISLSNMPRDHSHVSLISSQISGHFVVQYAARPFTCIINFLTDIGTFRCPICRETIHTYHYVPHRYRDISLSNMPRDHSHVSLISSQISGHFIVQYAARPFTCIITFLTDVGTFGCPICHETIHTYHYVPHRYRDISLSNMPRDHSHVSLRSSQISGHFAVQYAARPFTCIINFLTDIGIFRCPICRETIHTYHYVPHRYRDISLSNMPRDHSHVSLISSQISGHFVVQYAARPFTCIINFLTDIGTFRCPICRETIHTYHYVPHRYLDISLSNMPRDHSHVSLISSQISGHFVVQYATRPFTRIITFLTDIWTFGCPIFLETIHTYHYFHNRCREIWLSNMPRDHSHVSLRSSQISGHLVVQYAARPFTRIITFLTDIWTFRCPICRETIHMYH